MKRPVLRSSALVSGPLVALVLLAQACWSQPPAATGLQSQTQESSGAASSVDPVTNLRRGNYQAVIDALLPATEAGAENRSVAAVELVAEAFLATGRSREAAALLERSLSTWPQLATRLGEALLVRGARDQARALFERAIAERHDERLSATLGLAQLEAESGDLARAGELYYSLIDAYNARDRLTTRELVAVGQACRWLGRDDPQLFKDALKAFDEAVAQDDSDPLPHIMLAELFLEKYDGPEAGKSVQPVLRRNENDARAVLASARILRFNGAPTALEAAERALEINQELVAAHVFRGELLLELEDFDGAEAAARAALEIDAQSPEALTTLAAAHYLTDDREAFESVRDGLLESNPRYASLFANLAELVSRTANYRSARDFANKAVEMDPKYWEGFHQLGMNQLRLGEIADGQKSLETAFAGDPYNLWVKNTLDLLDTFPQYETHRIGRFEVFVHQKEAKLMAPYVAGLAEEAYQDLKKRYLFEPPTPIRIEVYPSHADFSVRTVGLAGLGALGVCFGPVLAIDSPSARTIGEANWGSTLWHELAHTFTLELTRARIPRWLTEGISVHEERRGRPGWGDDVRPEFLEARLNDELLPLAELNNGIVRPKNAMQIGLSYYQASLVVQMIEQRYGQEKIVEILHGYRDGGKTEEIFERVLDTDLVSFDQEFEQFVDRLFAVPLAALGHDKPKAAGAHQLRSVLTELEAEGPDAEGQEADGQEPQEAAVEEGSESDSGESSTEVAEESEETEFETTLVQGGQHAATSPEETARVLEEAARKEPGSYRAQMRWGHWLYANDRAEEAIVFLERAKELFPQWASDSSSYRLLSKIYLELGDEDKARENLRQLIDLDETHHEAHLELAALLKKAGDLAGSAEILDRSMYVYPLKLEPHEELAELYEQLDEPQKALRERQAVVDLDPPDKAAALLRLARAQLAVGERSKARRSVLQSLEIAPGYDDAQKLLLEMRQTPDSNSGGGE